jgi:hypothetical protein
MQRRVAAGRVRGCALTMLAALAVLPVIAQGQSAGAVEVEDAGVRLTAPMDGWELPRDQPVAIAYFALWPPCSPKPAATCANGSDTCKNPRAAGGGGTCETRVSVNGQHILTHQLRADNNYAFSGIVPAETLPKGPNNVAVHYVCQGPRERPPVLAAIAAFSIVDLAEWEELGDEGEVLGADWASHSHGDGHLLASAAHRNTPTLPEEDGGREVAGAGAGQSGVRCAVMVYHANVLKTYEKRWMDKSILSILTQTHQAFDIYELNYGGSDSSKDSVVQQHLHLLQGKHYTFLSTQLDSHAAAMNYVLDRIFADGYDVAFNVNIDDYYAPTRFERQLEAISNGAHLVSSEFVRVTAANHPSGARDSIHVDYQPTYLTTLELFGDRVLDKRNARGAREAEDEDIEAQLAADHNVLCHPGIAFTRRFWRALSGRNSEKS